jgi:hypothetical protein
VINLAGARYHFRSTLPRVHLGRNRADLRAAVEGIAGEGRDGTEGSRRAVTGRLTMRQTARQLVALETAVYTSHVIAANRHA